MTGPSQDCKKAVLPYGPPRITPTLCYPMHMDWTYEAVGNLYYHPETDIIIYGEDMPDELLP